MWKMSFARYMLDTTVNLTKDHRQSAKGCNGFIGCVYCDDFSTSIVITDIIN